VSAAVIVDTSVWVDVLRDRTGLDRKILARETADADVVLARFTQLELLQGARDEREWSLLETSLAGQDYVEAVDSTWSDAARIYFDLRRAGLTVRSPIDCCIAQLAIEHGCLLLHRDRDFETIAKVTSLRQLRLPKR
jgi:predicted nucleic acid-binding protein